MKCLEFELQSDYTLPILCFDGKRALFDTGSILSVFPFSTRTMRHGFHARRLVGDRDGAIYRLRNFHVGRIHYQALDVFVPKRAEKDAIMILGMSMFRGLNWNIDTVNHRIIFGAEDEHQFVRKALAKDFEEEIMSSSE